MTILIFLILELFPFNQILINNLLIYELNRSIKKTWMNVLCHVIQKLGRSRIFMSDLYFQLQFFLGTFKAFTINQRNCLCIAAYIFMASYENHYVHYTILVLSNTKQNSWPIEYRYFFNQHHLNSMSLRMMGQTESGELPCLATGTVYFWNTVIICHDNWVWTENVFNQLLWNMHIR